MNETTEFRFICTRRQHGLATTYLLDLRFTSERDAVITMTTDFDRAYRWRHPAEAATACRMAAAIIGGAWDQLTVAQALPEPALDPVARGR